MLAANVITPADGVGKSEAEVTTTVLVDAGAADSAICISLPLAPTDIPAPATRLLKIGEVADASAVNGEPPEAKVK